VGCGDLLQWDDIGDSGSEMVFVERLLMGVSRICNNIYNDPALDEQAVAFWEGFRGIMRKYSDTPEGPHYT
jgi:hypothetical protein